MRRARTEQDRSIRHRARRAVAAVTLATAGLVMVPIGAAPAHADFFIVSDGGASGPGTLADAIAAANGNAEADMIILATPLVDTSAVPPITDTVTIFGAAANLTNATGPGLRVTGGTVLLGVRSLTTTAPGAAALEVAGGTVTVGETLLNGDRGIAVTAGTLALNTSTVVAGADAALEASDATVDVTATLLAGGAAGIVASPGAIVTVTDSTVTGVAGNAVAAIGAATVQVAQSTLTGNDGAALFADGASAHVTATHSVLTGNVGPAASTGTPPATPVAIEWSAVPAASPYAGTNHNIGVDDPMLAPPTAGSDTMYPAPAMLPLPGSPLINAGDPARVVSPSAVDQRGLPRLVSAAIDIGAVEFDRTVSVTATPPVVDEADGIATVTVQRGGAIDDPVSVRVSTASGTAVEGEDFTALDEVVSWDAGEGDPRELHVTILADGVDEGDESFDVQLSDAVGALVDGPPATITIKSTISPLIVRNTNPAGDGSLADAITFANIAGGPDVITFADGVAGTIDTASVPTITDGVTIVGPGREQVTLTRADGDTLSVGRWNVGTELTASGLTFADSAGSAIFLDGESTVRLDDVALVDNAKAGVNGVGEGQVIEVEDSLVSGNGFTGNFPGITGYIADVTVTRSTVTGNSAGGVMISFGSIGLTDSTVAANGFNTSFDGGGVDGSFGAIDITGSVIAGNAGDGITTINGTIDLTDSTVHGNGGHGVWANGDAVITGSTITANGEDGIATRGDLDIAFSTVSGNLEHEIGVESSSTDTLTITHSVLTGTGGGTGGLTIFGATPTIAVLRSVVPAASPLAGANGNVGADDPRLSALGDHGGPTPTMEPLPESPAIDAGDPAAQAGAGGVPLTDQRGNARRAGAAIDIGAVEFDRYVGITPPTIGGVEGGTVSVTVARTGSVGDAATVRVKTVDGTATAGSDYVAVDQTLSWPPGDASTRTVHVALSTDAIVEPTESFGVQLLDPTGARLGPDAGTVVQIFDVPPDPGPGPGPEPAPVGHDLVALTPARYLDTRSAPTFDGSQSATGAVAAGGIVRVPVAGRGQVAADASAVAVNVTVIDPEAPGYATMFACTDAPPVVSQLNFGPGDVVANHSIVALDGSGDLCVFVSAAADLALDVTGYAPPGSAVTMTTPQRYLDTRVADTPLAAALVEVPLDDAVPASARAVVVNLTVVHPDAAGYASVFPCGQEPATSTLNFAPGAVVPNGAVVPLSADRSVCIRSTAGTDLLLDVFGVVGASEPFVLQAGSRLLDTRAGAATVDGQQQGVGRVAAGAVVEVPVAGRDGVPADATAALVNVTVVDPADAGYVSVWPCGPQPVASIVNVTTGVVRANGALARLSADGSLCLLSTVPTDLILDVGVAITP